jgi:hypothetical protein
MSSTLYAALSAFQSPDYERAPIAAGAPMQRPERLIGFGEVRSRIGLSRSSIWRLERVGSFLALFG